MTVIINILLLFSPFDSLTTFQITAFGKYEFPFCFFFSFPKSTRKGNNRFEPIRFSETDLVFDSRQRNGHQIDHIGASDWMWHRWKCIAIEHNCTKSCSADANQFGAGQYGRRRYNYVALLSGHVHLS